MLCLPKEKIMKKYSMCGLTFIFMVFLFSGCQTTDKSQKNEESSDYLSHKTAHQDKGIAEYTKQIQNIELNLAFAYNSRGCIYYKNNDYDKAIEDYNKALSINPNFADAYNQRGIVYFAKQDYKKAIDDFNKAINLNPNFAEAYYNLGNLKYQVYVVPVFGDPEYSRSEDIEIGRTYDDDLKKACELGCKEACKMRDNVP